MTNRAGALATLLLVLVSVVLPAGARSTPAPPRSFSVYLGRTSTLSVKVVVSGDRVIGVATRGSLVCDHGGAHHRQLFVEGVPTDHGFTVIGRGGGFHYRQFEPFYRGLPASFEAMRGRIGAAGVRGRLRYWERAPADAGGNLCGTGAPQGRWIKFFATPLHRG
jgi:hypothetical protein